MSLRKKPTKGIDYWIFTGGRENELYLGPVNDSSKINSDRVLEALKYVKQRNHHYTDLENQLVNLLQGPFKEDYLSNRLKELDGYSEKLISSLSEDGKKKYLSRRAAELQTRLRLSMLDIIKAFEKEGKETEYRWIFGQLTLGEKDPNSIANALNNLSIAVAMIEFDIYETLDLFTKKSFTSEEMWAIDELARELGTSLTPSKIEEMNFVEKLRDVEHWLKAVNAIRLKKFEEGKEIHDVSDDNRLTTNRSRNSEKNKN